MSYKEIPYKIAKDNPEISAYSDQFLSVVGALYSVINGTVRIFWGFLLPRTTFRKIYTVVLIGQVGRY